MELGLLYSGGTDSTLAALLLDPFYDVTLVTARFGFTDDWEHARESAETLGFDFRPVDLDRAIAEEAADRIIEDGYPRHGVQHVHERALEAIAAGEVEGRSFDAVADGTRRDDRVPTVSRALAQHLEEVNDVDYIAPLSGFGRSAVDRLVETHLEVVIGPSDEIPRADYEAEIRALIAEEYGRSAVEEHFPVHEQTSVRGRR